MKPALSSKIHLGMGSLRPPEELNVRGIERDLRAQGMKVISISWNETTLRGTIRFKPLKAKKMKSAPH